MAIETWQDAIGRRAVLRGYPNIVLRVKHIHADFDKPQTFDDIRPSWGGQQKPAACVCEVVYGRPPESWEPCTPFGHYRVAAKDLIFIETPEDIIGTMVTVRGYPDVLLRVKHIHGDVMSPDWDLHPWNREGMPAPQPAACVCEVIAGTPPESWETCTPFGHYRVAAKDLCLEGEPRV